MVTHGLGLFGGGGGYGGLEGYFKKVPKKYIILKYFLIYGIHSPPHHLYKIWAPINNYFYT
jgi:hypothetical protein